MINKFRYWCYKILPLVYDDSLSYYELLAKIVGKLNEIIDSVNINTESVYQEVRDILNEWLLDGTMNELINETAYKELYDEAIVGKTCDIEQKFINMYPFPTSAGARTDVVPTTSAAYYQQGFCFTPNGFIVVRLAPEQNKINANDISQLFEFSRTGEYIRSAGVDVHHGDGIVYYDGYLYCDIGATVAKIDYDTLTIKSEINLSGSHPVIDREHGYIYSVNFSTGVLYRYEIATDEITTVNLSTGYPVGYNGGFFHNGIIYYNTSNFSLLMFSTDGTYLGAKRFPREDSYGVTLNEVEDYDVDWMTGEIWCASNMALYSTSGVDAVNGSRISIRNPGFHIGRVWLNAGASAPYRYPKFPELGNFIYLKHRAAGDYNCKLQNGNSALPFESFSAASFLRCKILGIDCADYTILRHADVYNPVYSSGYIQIRNLNISTYYPIAFKSVDAGFISGTITISNYGVTMCYGRYESVDMSIADNPDANMVARVYYGSAEILLTDAERTYLVDATNASLQGCNIGPTTNNLGESIHYTYNIASQGDTVTLRTIRIGGARGRRMALMSNTERSFEIFALVGNHFYGTNGTVIAATVDADNASYTFTAPYNIYRLSVF